jgi:hypothetical protein
VVVDGRVNWFCAIINITFSKNAITIQLTASGHYNFPLV